METWLVKSSWPHDASPIDWPLGARRGRVGEFDESNILYAEAKREVWTTRHDKQEGAELRKEEVGEEEAIL